MAAIRVRLQSLFLEFLMILTTLVSYNTSNPTGFSLKLIPRDTPDSPFFKGYLPQTERIKRMVEFSKARAEYIGNTIYSPENVQLKVYNHDYIYTVQVSLGTPESSQTLIMDTGSSLLWTQCKPCTNCFHQLDPIFTPKASTTYRKLPCNHQLCTRELGFQCVNGECTYSKSYSDGSKTKGVVSSETFTFPLRIGRMQPVTNLVFGCSNNSQNISFDHSGHISGVLGLSASPESLINQLGVLTNRRFSYCFAYNRPMTLNSMLRFGEDIVFQNPNIVKRTPFVEMDRRHLYYLNLVDISVAGHRLMFKKGTFAIRRDGTGGCIIDSGSVLTRMDRQPYRVVISDFDRYFSRFHLERVHNSSEELELCYKQRPSFRDYAGMTFHFEGADFIVRPMYMYVHNEEKGYFCVALMPSVSTDIGSWQQQNTRFVYDLKSKQLQFAYEDCSHAAAE